MLVNKIIVGGKKFNDEELTITENGTYTAPEGVRYTPINVSVSGSGGGIGEGQYEVKVLNYKGEIIDLRRMDTGDIYNLNNIDNYSSIKSYITTNAVINSDNTIIIKDYDVIIYYYRITESIPDYSLSKNYLFIKLNENTGLTVDTLPSSAIDWGDGTSGGTSHTYSDYGAYMITLGRIAYTDRTYTNLFNKSSNNFLVGAIINNIVDNNGLPATENYLFYSCRNLKFAICNVEYIRSDLFNSCYSLKVAYVDGYREISSNALRSCSSVEIISIKNTSLAQAINANTFSSDYNLRYVKLPKNIKYIYQSAFSFNTKMEEIDFTEFDEPPNLSNVNAFANINPFCKFTFKNQEVLDKFASATNWSTFASYMKVKE